MLIFTASNEFTGTTAHVYQRGPHIFEVELSDASGGYIAGHIADTAGTAITYALEHV